MSFAHIQMDPPVILKELRRHPRADGGQPVGLIPGTAVVPVVQQDRPDHDSVTHHLVRTETVTPSSVVRGWSVVPRPADEVARIIREAMAAIVDEHFPPFDRMRDLNRRQGPGGGPPAFVPQWQWVDAMNDEADAKIAAAAVGDPFDIDDWPEFTP